MAESSTPSKMALFYLGEPMVAFILAMHVRSSKNSCRLNIAFIFEKSTPNLVSGKIHVCPSGLS